MIPPGAHQPSGPLPRGTVWVWVVLPILLCVLAHAIWGATGVAVVLTCTVILGAVGHAWTERKRT